MIQFTNWSTFFICWTYFNFIDIIIIIMYKFIKSVHEDKKQITKSQMGRKR